MIQRLQGCLSKPKHIVGPDKERLETPTSESKMPRRIHHVHGTLKHRNMQRTDKANTSTYQAHMHDEVHENDRAERGGAE